MRTFVLLLTLMSFLSACKKEKNKRVILTGDCTGFYLRIDGSEYRICNDELVDPSKIGQEIQIDYVNLDTCEMTGPGCALVHPIVGYVQIDSM